MIDDFKKHFIGHYNNHYGTILIGVLPNKNIIGLDASKETIEDIINKQISEIKTSIVFLDYFKINIEKVNGEKNIGIVRVTNRYNSICFDSQNEDSYLVVNNSVKKASILDIINLANKQVLDFYEHCNVYRLENFLNYFNDFKQMIEMSTAYNIKMKIEKSFLYLSDIFNIKAMKTDSSITNYSGNGISNGDIVYLSTNKIRLEDTMTRCTAPSFNIDEKISSEYNIVENGILIVDGGASYIINNETHKIITNCGAIYLKVKDKYKDSISIYSVLAWLKSSILLWYILFNLGSDNIYMPNIFSRIIIPKKIAENKREIHIIINDIINKENDFLKNIEKQDDSDNIIKHNKEINNIAQLFDDNINRFMGLTKKEINNIEDYLISKKHCLYRNKKAEEINNSKLNPIGSM